MKKIRWVLCIFLYNYLFSHMCHDPFRPRERLVLLPEKEEIKIEAKGEFRIYVENTFSSTLRDFQLIVKSKAFEINVEPPILEKLVPGERTSFLIKLSLKEGYKPGEYPLHIDIKARSAEIKPTVEKIDILTEEKKEEPEPPPKEEKEENNNDDDEEEDDEKDKQEREEVEKDEKEKEVEKEEREVERKEAEEREIEPVEEVEPEEAKEDTPQIIVKVERIPFWRKPYFYIILILFLIFILIWRKRKRK